jgi:RNA polymerase sigma-70 factor (ECF subfamily)
VTDLGALRPLATAVAYRMLGSRTEAEDVAQEAILRVHAAGPGSIRSPEAFVTTVATRLAIDHLRSARVRRERYVGPWLPEPVTSDPLADGPAAVELAESLSVAFLTLLESLGPVERAAFLLREVFGYGYDEVATVVGRSEPACRQIVARARRRVAEGRPRHVVDPAEHRRVLERFLAAARRGEVDELVAVLAEDVVLVSDGGATVRAARHPIVGRRRVAHFLRTVGPHVLERGRVEVGPVNGEPGFLVTVDGTVQVAGTIDVVDGRVAALRWVLNPDKLGWVVPERPA